LAPQKRVACQGEPVNVFPVTRKRISA
jgi:hypothetical protein